MYGVIAQGPARQYSFIQLSELGHRGENENAKFRNSSKGRIGIRASLIKSLLLSSSIQKNEIFNRKGYKCVKQLMTDENGNIVRTCGERMWI